MASADMEKAVELLSEGFTTLQDEYKKLFGQHQALERKLATAREQYNELAKLCNSGPTTTPPLSLASSYEHTQRPPVEGETAADILYTQPNSTSKEAADKVRLANTIASSLHRTSLKQNQPTNSVHIWSGPSADRPSSGLMPSISESPLEQDFTVEGKPSKLGCPFASMANKKLSSHAASVLSRYNGHGSNAGGASNSPTRINGRDSISRKTGDQRRASFVDPIKAEICGLSDHQEDQESPMSERAMKEHLERQESVEVGVCPIRFLDQHSPEEVATYFERHKHELPRSHEVCVKRYQSNEKQIRELDAKYGNLVSMIQGLGAKHKEMLPKEPDEDEEAEALDPKSSDEKNDEQVRQWASSVSVHAAEPGRRDYAVDEDGGRQPHFERALRDVRVGESPSRPWGIQVPAKYLETEDKKPDQVKDSGKDGGVKQAAQCPFGFDRVEKGAEKNRTEDVQEQPTFISSTPMSTGQIQEPNDSKSKEPRMVFNGPVFIGYSPEDAAKFLNETGLNSK